MKLVNKVNLALAFILLTPLNAFSDEQNISIFKNGTSFTVRKIKQNTSFNNKELIINNLPDALFGTIFFNPYNNTITNLVSENELVSEKAKAETLADLFNSNIGSTAKLTLISNEVLEIKIEKIQNDLIIGKDLKANNDSTLVLNLQNIKTVNFLNAPKYDFEKKVSKKVIKIELKNHASNQALDMMYMQKGLTWLPSYQIELKDNEKANITLTANLINDAEDFEKADLSLVVGYPNFSYAHLKSPLTSMQEMNDFFYQLNAPSNNYSNNGIMQQRMSNMSNIATQAVDYAPESDENQESTNISQEEDLYFYKIPQKVSLKKSARAMFELFSEEINYQNTYEVELESNQAKYYYYQSKSNAEIETSQTLPKVWHSLKLNNSTKYPFTTGTAMVIKADNNTFKPISQDKINYTPIGSKTKLKLTLSPDILVKETEKEVERKENIKLQDSSYFDLVTIESKITIKNSKKKAIKLNINRVVEGELLNSSHKWNVNHLNIYKVQNKTNKIEWETDLKAEESKEIKYKYSIYVRR